MNTERAIWILTLIFFLPFFFIFSIISAHLISDLSISQGSGALLKDFFLMLISVISGYYLSVKWNEIQIKNSQREKRLTALSNLKRSIKLNVDLLKITGPVIGVSGAATFRLDSASLNLALSKMVGILEETLITDINWQRIQIEHVSTKLAALEYVYIDLLNHQAKQPHTDPFYQGLNTELHRHAAQARGDLEKLLERIEAEEIKRA
jgi:hypothetical protein